MVTNIQSTILIQMRFEYAFAKQKKNKKKLFALTACNIFFVLGFFSRKSQNEN